MGKWIESDYYLITESNYLTVSNFVKLSYSKTELGYLKTGSKYLKTELCYLKTEGCSSPTRNQRKRSWKTEKMKRKR